MTTRSSRYHRPEEPLPLALTVRDRTILTSVFEHRYLSAEHVHQLLFAGVGLRRAQERLRRLWSHRLLDRHFVSFVLDGEHPPPKSAGRPIYGLARRGAAVVAADTDLPLADVPYGFDNRGVGLPTLEHHLVATDFLVALQVACRGRGDIELTSIDQEALLWRKIASLKKDGRHEAGYLVSDGAFALTYRPSGEAATFHIEVVRANVKGGNETLAKKFRRYAELHHAGYFERVFGQARVRAILFITTSIERAEHFRQLALRLAHGRRLFWFGVYAARGERGRETTTLTPESILSPRWTTVDGNPISFVPPSPPCPTGASANPTSFNVCAQPSTPNPDAPGSAPHLGRDDIQATASTIRDAAG